MRICIYIHYNILIFLYLAGLIDEGRSWSLFRIFCPSQGVSPSPLTGGLVLTLSHLSLSSLRVWRERGSQRDRTLLSSRPLAHGGGGQPQSGTSPPLDERLRHPSWWTQRFASDPKLGPRFGHTMAPPSHPPRLRALDPHRGQRIGEAARPGPSSSLRDTSGTRGDTPPTATVRRSMTRSSGSVWPRTNWPPFSANGCSGRPHGDGGLEVATAGSSTRAKARPQPCCASGLACLNGMSFRRGWMRLRLFWPSILISLRRPRGNLHHLTNRRLRQWMAPPHRQYHVCRLLPCLPPTGLMSLLSCTLMSHRPCLRNQRTSRAAGAVVSGWVNPCAPKGPSPPRRFKLLIRFAQRFWGA